MKHSSIFQFRKLLFDAHAEDPSYNPTPDERPGGFDWGAGGAPADGGGPEVAEDQAGNNADEVADVDQRRNNGNQ